jgi:hypothetical protein
MERKIIEKNREREKEKKRKERERKKERNKNIERPTLKKRCRIALVGQVINLDPFLHLTFFIFLPLLCCCLMQTSLDLLPFVFCLRFCHIKVENS